MPEIAVPDLHRTFHADPDSVSANLAQMLDLPPLADMPDDSRGLAELVLAEVLNNVAEHAYCDAGGSVSVSLSQGPSGIRCLIVDQGRAMPGGNPPEGRLPRSSDVAVEDLPEGGFGWHLIRTLSTDMTYARVDGQNRLGFVLPAHSQPAE